MAFNSSMRITSINTSINRAKMTFTSFTIYIKLSNSSIKIIPISTLLISRLRLSPINPIIDKVKIRPVTFITIHYKE